MKKQFTFLLMLLVIGSASYAQKSITQLNTAYTDDFNTLNNSVNDNTLPTGWFLSETGTNADNTYAPSTGSSTAGNTYSFGAASSTDRALGTLASGSVTPSIGIAFTNNTGSTVDSVAISYYVEQWRLGATGRQDSMVAQWSPNGTLWFNLPLLSIYSVVTTGTTGALDGNATANRQYIRHVLPVPSIANGVSVWLRWTDVNITGSDDGLAIDDFSIIAYGGSGTTDPAPCTEPFFSEYIEGSGNNKALEVYNPSPQNINLGNYLILRFNNGSPTPSDTMFLTGTLSSGSVYVIANPSAMQAILNEADTTHTITFYNGDDALALLNITTGKIVDLFGVLGQDPGTNWPIGSGATSENTLVRKNIVRHGTTDSTTWANGWEVYAQNTTTYLGSHTSNCIAASKTVTFTTTSINRVEADDSVAVGVTVINPDTFSVLVEVNIGAGTTAATGSDYDYTNQTLSFPPLSHDTQWVYIRLYDDLVIENNKAVELRLQNVLGADLGDSIFVLTILDNDVPPIPLSQIADINDVDANGVTIHMDSLVKVGGIVHDFNHNGNFRGLEFAIQNRNEGIVIFNSADTLGYTVQMGDSIVVVGKITQYNGLVEIIADSIYLISRNNSMYTPKAVNSLSEATEAVLVTLPQYRLINPNQWGSGTFVFNAHITNGADTFTMRVHDETDLFTAPAPTGYFNVTGIGWQFDNTSPYLHGYQIIPRSIADITALADPMVSFAIDSQSVMENSDSVNVSITINNITGEAHSVDVAVHAASTAIAGTDYVYATQRVTFPANSTVSQTVTVTIVDDIVFDGDKDLILVLRNSSAFAAIGSDSIHVIRILDNEPSGINEKQKVKVQVYPNPAENFTKVVSAATMQTITVTNLAGQQQLRVENLNVTEYSLNLDNLASGVYLISIHGKDYKTTKQLMVK